MAKFGRVGKAGELLGEERTPEAAQISGAPTKDSLVDETTRDILFFTFSGSPSDRRFLTALGEVQRCVAALGGTFVPLRTDAPRGIYSENFIMVSFCIPVTVQRGKEGTLGRQALLALAVKTDPALCTVLAEIEGGIYDGRK